MGGSTPCFKDVLLLLWSPDPGDRRMVNDVDRSQRFTNIPEIFPSRVSGKPSTI